MIGDPALGLVYGAMVLILVGSALAVRRLNRSQMLQMGLGWAAIFAVAFLVAWLLGPRL